jgi:hypothetical protein
VALGPQRTPRPSWASLPPSARVFRLAHITWGAAALCALADIWLTALRPHRRRRPWASVALLAVEGVALAVGRGDCPLGTFQRRLGDPVPMFELVLPPRAAKAAIPVLFVVSAAGMVILPVRLLRVEAVGPDSVRRACRR